MKINDIFDRYIKEIEKTCSELTVSTYKYKLGTALRNMHFEKNTDLSKADAQAFVECLMDKYKSKTVRAIYDVVNAAYKLAIKDGYISSNPFEHISIEITEPYCPVCLTVEEIQDFLYASRQNQTVYLPVLLTIETGLRRNQVLTLTWSDVNFSTSTITISKGAINERICIPMSDYLSETLLCIKNYRRSIGVGVNANDYICLTGTFKAMEPTYFNKLFRLFVRANDRVPDNLRFEDLRYLFNNNDISSFEEYLTIVKSGTGNFMSDKYYRQVA